MPEARNVTVVHAVPGRVRVRVDPSMRSPGSMQELARTVSGFGGVRGVQVNQTTGSILIQYDPQSVGLEELFLAARAANVNILVPGSNTTRPAAEGPSQVAQTINSAFGRMDRAVSDFTGGRLDAKTLAPLVLGGVAVRQIVASGGHLTAAPWYTLLWYSFGIFTRYNLGKGPKPRPPVDGE